ncbi:hypothetical protein [Fontivita pretiosa]|uniref:hypothetical protein n=1 Tax=Fontivita pretiosa TaxID=2989684 RepID=UPI003D163701
MYVETIQPSSALADHRISVWIKPSGTSSFQHGDHVRVTATDIQLYSRNPGSTEYERAYHFVSSYLPGVIDSGRATGTYATYKVRILDPRTTGLSQVRFSGNQTIPLAPVEPGVHKSAEFVVARPGATTESHPYIVHAGANQITVS